MRSSRLPPWWMILALAVLFVGPVLTHEPVFGDGVGLIAAGAGVGAGLLIALAATWWRWDALTVVVAVLVAYLLGGGPAAVPSTTIAGVLPSLDTLQLLAVQSVTSWKDLLTLAPPASSYVGPAVMPWLAGLLCGAAAGLLCWRAGRYLLGSLPILALGLLGVAWGMGDTRPPVWQVMAWTLLLLAWWAGCAQWRRVGAGEDVLVGRRVAGGAAAEDSLSGAVLTGGRRVQVVHGGRRLLAGLLTLAVAGATVPAALGVWPAFNERRVLRDLVEPPLDIKDFPSPLASFRHYTTDLAGTELVTVSSLPEGGRVRLAVMDTYNGIAFGMSDPAQAGEGRYVRAGERLLSQPWEGEGVSTELGITATGLSGPWLPSAGVPDRLDFTGDRAAHYAGSLYQNRWANALLSTAADGGPVAYQLHTVIPPVWSDGQLAGVSTGQLTGTPDTGVPEAVEDLARDLAASEMTPLARARALERHLARGFFSNGGAANSRPGHRADRLSRMLQDQELVGDDEQYATLMALMLHSLGIPARVVMGLYPEGLHGSTTPVTLRGSDMHAWVEVEFVGVGWAVFDPTPSRNQTPQTNVPRPQPVPRPQVLQPPEPPEPPIELPPSVSERPAEDPLAEPIEVPWAWIGAGGGGLLLLVGPILAILLAKRSRARRRRQAADPVVAVSGAWDEVVDLAADAGSTFPRALTRQETALAMTALWDPAGEAVEAGSASSWDEAEQRVPEVVALAWRADTAVFSPDAPTTTDVDEAWDATTALRTHLLLGVGPLRRARWRLSLRSLRRQARTRRSLRPGRRRER